MGRPFTEQERDVIKETLFEKGKSLFSKKELRKTSIEELAKSAGIAQGSFYAFYDCKEELFFEILESEEKEIITIIEKKLQSIEFTRKEFKRFLIEIIELVVSNPFLQKILHEQDYRDLLAKIPKKKYQDHLHTEYQVTKRLVVEFQEQKNMKKVGSEILSALFYALFLLHLHRSEIGKEVFPAMFEFLIDIISDALVNRGNKNLDETEENYAK